MDFSNLNATDDSNEDKKSVSFFDFEMVLEAIGLVLTGKQSTPFYLGVVIDGLWKSALYTIYYAHKNTCGDHADSFIAMQEKRIMEGEGMIDWLYADNFQPQKGSSLAEVLTELKIRDERTKEEYIFAEMIEECEDYEKYGITDESTETECNEAYNNQLTQAERDEIDELIKSYEATDIADSKSAIQLTNTTISSLELRPGQSAVSGEYLYVQLSKIKDKLDKYAMNAKSAYRTTKTKDKNNKKFIAEKKANWKLLTDAFNLAQNVIRLADEVDKSSNLVEISNMVDDITSDNLDMPVGWEGKDFNEGYITP